MDLNLLADMKNKAGADPAAGLFDGIMTIHRLLRKIERAGMDPKTLKGGKPIAWAAPGLSAGIGTEIGLACHRRFLADQPEGPRRPAILIGIFPGAGGTTRLVRMLGLMPSAPLLLEGRMLAPAAAKSAGLVDEVVPPAELIAKAKAWVLTAGAFADIVKPWDAKGYKLPGGSPYHPAGFMTYVGASAMVHGRTQGAYPAARAMLSAIYEGTLVDFDTALRIEARWFTRVLLDPSSAAMIRTLFLNKQALEKGASRPPVPDQTVQEARHPRRRDDGGRHRHRRRPGRHRGRPRRPRPGSRRPRQGAERRLLRRRCEETEEPPPRSGDAALARLTATPDQAALSGCDLVVEAVFEDPAVKAEATRQAEANLAPGAGLRHQHLDPADRPARESDPRPGSASSASTSSPRSRRWRWSRSFAARKPATSPSPRALDFVRQIGKTPIVVNDARFFYANRCILPYINEGVRLVAEGVEPALIENAARQLGFPLGPLQLTDEVSLDLGVKIARATKAALGDAYPESPADDVIFALADRGRLGRKAAAGFYAYDDKGKRQGLWPGLRASWPPRADQPALVEVQHRLAMVQALEAVRALEEGVLTDIREGDVGAILGWGFMPWSGGPFSWLDILGAREGRRDRRHPRRELRAALRRAAAAARDGGRRARASTGSPPPGPHKVHRARLDTARFSG